MIVPSFVVFVPGLPYNNNNNNVPPMVLPVFGPPRVGPLGVGLPSRLIYKKSHEEISQSWALSYHQATLPFLYQGILDHGT